MPKAQIAGRGSSLRCWQPGGEFTSLKMRLWGQEKVWTLYNSIAYYQSVALAARLPPPLTLIGETRSKLLQGQVASNRYHRRPHILIALLHVQQPNGRPVVGDGTQAAELAVEGEEAAPAQRLPHDGQGCRKIAACHLPKAALQGGRLNAAWTQSIIPCQARHSCRSCMRLWASARV